MSRCEGEGPGITPPTPVVQPNFDHKLGPLPLSPLTLAESTLVRDERSFRDCTHVSNLPQGRTGRTFVPVHLPSWFRTPHRARLPRACPEDMSAPRRVSSTAGKRLRIPDTLPLEKGNACTSCESSSTPAASPRNALVTRILIYQAERGRFAATLASLRAEPVSRRTPESRVSMDPNGPEGVAWTTQRVHSRVVRDRHRLRALVSDCPPHLEKAFVDVTPSLDSGVGTGSSEVEGLRTPRKQRCRRRWIGVVLVDPPPGRRSIIPPLHSHRPRPPPQHEQYPRIDSVPALRLSSD
jgi:hypothetical protein